MTATTNELRALEGKRVSLMLIDGTLLDGCRLVSAGRASVRTLWVFRNGDDAFIPMDEVRDVRATAPPRGAGVGGQPAGVWGR
jgi:hypothetical protein